MLQVILFTLSVLLASVSGWGNCVTRFTDVSFNGVCGAKQSVDGLYCSTGSVSTEYCCERGGEQSNYSVTIKGGSQSCSYHLANVELQNGQSCKSQNYSGYIGLVLTVCSSQSEADSVKCELNPSLPECQTTTDTTIYYCLTQKGATGYISEVRRCSCKSLNGSVYQCNGKSNINVNQDCPVIRTYNGTCSENGYRDGQQADSTASTAQCYAVIGSKCYMKDIASGNTFSCECDGSCNKAMNDLIAGNGCSNPYPQPEPPPDSVPLPFPPDDTTQTPPDTSGDDDDKYMEVLNAIRANTQGTMNNTADIASYTQTTMDNTTDIKNILEGDIAIDVKHIRTSTENIDETTQSIDNQLSTTNTLLNQIKNKDFSPDVHFNPTIEGDTNIINVTVNGDTARAPSEILAKLNQSDYNASDTAGSGESERDLLARLDSSANESVPNLKDSLPNAVYRVNRALYNLRDTLNKGAYMDSVTSWEIKLVDNGVLSGGGSTDCPEPLRRNYSWNFGPKIGSIQLGSFRYICEDFFGFGITLWGLARMVLRCMVSIACMLWIYRTVIGVEGGNDED